MKKHLSKRLLSLLLAVVMVATSAPFVASAASDDWNGDTVRYLFAYFTGDDSEEIRLAVSENGFDFEALNGNRPVLDSANVSGVYPEYAASDVNDSYNNTYNPIAASGKARDPYIIPDSDGTGYYILATDLAAEAQQYRNSKLLVWHIDDLGKASEVKPWNIETMMWFNNYLGSGTGDKGYPDFYAWAPGAFWDESKDMYLLYWSAGRSGDSRSSYASNNSNYNSFSIYGVYTPDFKEFYNLDDSGSLKLMDASSQAILMYDPSNYVVIDADIMYNEDDGYYYMWHKNENSNAKYLVWVRSRNLTGPYEYVDGQSDFRDADYSGYMEGPFLYQLADGRYVLMMDWYKDNSYSNCEFLSYISSNPVDFMHNDITDLNTINYLKPRHGKVCQIGDKDYKAVIDSYGKVTFSGQNYFPANENSSINDDTLIARYFINDDLNKDNTGNGYDLSSANLTVGFDDERTYAVFGGGGESAAGNAGYAERTLSELTQDNNLNAKDGVTVSFYARNRSGDSNRRFFELTTYDRGEWVTNNPQGSYVNWTSNRYEVQVSEHIGENTVDSNDVGYYWYSTGEASSDWSLYTMTVTESFVSVSIDGVLVSSVSPVYRKGLTEDIFNEFMNGNLLIGCSSWNSDPMFAGDIYDFRIYNRALSNDEVQASLDELGSATYVGDTLGVNDHSKRDFYDPMETVSIEGIDYTQYANTVTDGTLGNVLNLNGSKIDANYAFNPKQSDNGYTISFWYNPGSSIDGTIFNIGQYNADSDAESKSSTKKYFALTESGTLWYCYNDGSGTQSYGDIDGLFGEGLALNTWQNIVIQIVPSGNYDVLYTYIDGEIVDTFETYKSVVRGTTDQRTMTADRTVIDYFANAASINESAANANDKIAVRYGCNYHTNYGGQASGMIDDFSFYSSSYAAQDVYADTAINHSETLIYTAIEMYKDRMNQIYTSEQNGEWQGGMIYTNMANAYDVYDEVCRFLDATDPEKGDFRYEEQEMKAYLADYFVKLMGAVNDMQPYETPEDIGGMTYMQSGVNTPIDAQYTNNMLSSVNISRMSEWKGGTMKGDDEYSTDDAGQNMSVASGSFVWMYTGKAGDTSKAPLNAGVYCNDYKYGVHYYSHYLYPTNSVLAMDGDWQMTGSSTIDWYYNNGASKGSMYGYYSNDNGESNYYLGYGNPWAAGADVAVGQGTTVWGYGSGVIKFTGTENDFNGNYYLTVSPVYNACLHTVYSGGNQHNSPKVTDGSGSFWPQGDIYVINYAKVADSLFSADKIAHLKNITAYTPDSVRPVLKAYDDLTSTEYRFNTPSAQSVSDFAAELQQKVNDLERAVEEHQAVDKATDDVARAAVEAETPDYNEYTKMPEEGQPYGYEKFTDSSWRAYDEAYNALKNYYASLNPHGENRHYSTDQAFLDQFASNLESASQHLVEKADFTRVVDDTADDSTYTATYNAGNGSSYQDQKYTFKTWYNFKTNYEKAEDWAELSGETYFANDTPKYELGFQSCAIGDNEASRPYVALHRNADGTYTVVNNAELLADKDNIVYKYWADTGFYENQNDAQTSQFETGTWVVFEGEWVNLENSADGVIYRFAPTQIPVTTEDGYSAPQTSIITSSDNVRNATFEQLADYTVYDAATDLLNYQDLGAFADADAKNAVFGILDEQGIKYGDKTYSTGVSASDAEAVHTAAYQLGDPEKAYVTDASGTVWKNYSEKPESQAELDKYTQNVLETLEQVNTDVTGELRKTVTVNYSFKSSDGADIESGTEEWFYGDGFTLTAPEGYHVYRWEVTDLANNKTMVLPAADSYYAQLTGDVSITAYCSTEQTEGTVVKIQNQYGNEIQQYVLAEEQQVSVGVRSYTVADETIELVDPPFYAFTGWSVNGTVYDAAQLPQNIDLSSAKDGVITLRPMYEVASGQYTVTVDGLTVAGISETNPGVEYVGVYDDSVTLFPEEGAYGIAAKIGDSYYAVSYGDTPYSFFLINDVELYAITDNGDGTFAIGDDTVDGDTAVKLAKKLPFAYAVGNTEAAAGKFTAYGATTAFVDEGVVSEVGIIFTRNADIGTNAESFVIGADGVTTAPAKNQLDTMQYGVRVSTADGSVVYARPYVKYTYTTENVSSENGSAVNDSTVIQTIEYGNIVSSN